MEYTGDDSHASCRHIFRRFSYRTAPIKASVGSSIADFVWFDDFTSFYLLHGRIRFTRILLRRKPSASDIDLGVYARWRVYAISDKRREPDGDIFVAMMAAAILITR